MAELLPVVAGVAAGLTAPAAMVALQDSAAKSGVTKRQIANLFRRIKVTALDKMLRDIINRTDEKYSVFMGTLDAFPDNLIAEALADGADPAHIAHTIFSSEETALWLREQLNRILPMSKVNGFLRTFHLGVPVPCDEFAKALVDRMAARKEITWVQPSDNASSPDLTPFCEVDELVIPNGAKCSLHAEGIVLIRHASFFAALVPDLTTVRLLVHRDCDKPKSGSQFIERTRREIVGGLIERGCDAVLAWRCLAIVSDHNQSFEEFRDRLLEAFTFVSKFRSALVDSVLAGVNNNKRLIGDKAELDVLHMTRGQQELQKRLEDTFKPGYDIFSSAKRLESSQVHPFLASVFEIDPLDVNLTILEKMIERARKSDLNRGKGGKSVFNARTVAVLGAFDGKQVYRGAISNRVKNQFFYQDDSDTKSLSTPFSQLMLFSTTNFVDFKLEDQVQYLHEYSMKLNNWIALRAALEFDIVENKFRYGTDSFRRAEDLLNKSVADFVMDNTLRFSQCVDEASERVYVSYVKRLCDSIADKTGASSAWLVREMISRYVAHGLQVTNVGPNRNDCYGRFESIVQAGTACEPTGSRKSIVFDTRVSIEGVMCEPKRDGSVILVGPVKKLYDAELSSSEGEAGSRERAVAMLERGSYDHLEVIPKDKSPMAIRRAAPINFVGD